MPPNPRIIYKDENGKRKVGRARNAHKIFKTDEVLTEIQKDRLTYLENKFKQSNQRKRRKRRANQGLQDFDEDNNANYSEDDGNAFLQPDADIDQDEIDPIIEELANLGVHDTSRQKPKNAYSNYKKTENWKKIHKVAAETLINEKHLYRCRDERLCAGKTITSIVICISLCKFNIYIFEI